ncbi:photosynthesis system II assembly factor Ycf48 [Leptolyngbya sp. CCY15150]|uniref:photosynthesis system II assembly factor Ycf48 n=1 Tax=Leptolyngbya sp. CCY15150 TaxID=2767772 RepID=UPI00194F2020|nr:photosynthesis system II assembly factor Ycf48 [Leptolyngbya sp. CCY15150]
MLSFPKSIARFVILCVALLFASGCTNAYLEGTATNAWHTVSIPTDATLLDIAFAEDAQHGWLVGKQSTVLETNDGGVNWKLRSLDLGDQNYNLNSVSFYNNEGWIVGLPSLLLHTTDGGDSWSRVPLSDQLPGSPDTITALGDGIAELTTDIGAIYRTQDAGRNWRAMVTEAVGVLRNISRSADGRYVSVSSRGNFYSTWVPGDDVWVQHNRNSSRRLQNMGFTADGRLWLIARGGIVQFGETEDDLEAWSEAVTPEFATSWGFLDLTYQTEDDVWLAGGSGNLFYSPDGGKTWQKDKAVENVPSNFYRVMFVNPELGFILGQSGVLLRYDPATAELA